MEPRQPSPAASRSGLRRLALPLILAAAGVAALVYFLAPYGSEISTAFNRASPGTLLGITALSLVALPLRTEVWRSGLAAARRHPPRRDLHAANGTALLVGLANHYAAPAVKMWLLRKMEGERAAYLLKLATIDAATALLEALLAAALVVVAVFEVALPWWMPTLLLTGAFGLLSLAIIAWRRYPDNHVVQGLSVLMRARYRWEVLLLLALVFLAQIVRTWMSLRAVGVPVGLGDALFVFVLTGVFGFLPSGVTAAPTAASLIVVGHTGIGRAAASGILVTGSLVTATVVYCAVALSVRFLTARRRRRAASSPEAA